MSASDPGSIAKIAAGEPVVITDMALVEVCFSTVAPGIPPCSKHEQLCKQTKIFYPNAACCTTMDA